MVIFYHLLLILVTSFLLDQSYAELILLLIFLKSQLLVYLYLTDFLKILPFNICFKNFNFFLILL